jgi:CheY-like chemotaxis protein
MPKCVLVVDDDLLNVQLVKRTLEAKGYEVLTAHDGLEALEALNKKIPDLILLDVQMPRMDGYTFIMKKTSTPAIAGIPVIVLSAMEKTVPLFKRHGVKAYLLKPIDTQDLLNKITAFAPLDPAPPAS